MGRLRFFLSILITLFLLTGCSTEVKYKILSFVFDGVPNPNMENPLILKDTLNVVDSIANEKIKKPQTFIHSPYQERNCIACHNEELMGKIQNRIPAICYNCHTNLKNEYKFLHGPVDAGYCIACHQPHYSNNEELLIKTGDELCLYCHDSKQIYSNKIHSELKDYSCTDCHDSHGGDDKTFQKPGTCYKCHEDFNLKYKYVHGPVAGEYCTTCHGSHTLDSKKLVLRQGQQLCLYCHDRGRIFNSETHSDIEDANCTECHNPHGGENMELLY